MDPLSITGAILSITAQCLSTAKAFNDLRTVIQNAEVTIAAICSECTVLSVSLSQVQNFVLAHPDAFSGGARFRPDVEATFDTALTGCKVVLAVLDSEVQDIYISGRRPLGFKGKVKYAWNENKIRGLLEQLRGQQIAITLLIQCLQMSSTSRIEQLLKKSQPRLDELSMRTVSLRREYPRIRTPQSIFENSLNDVKSIYTGPSMTGATYFDFDQIVLDSPVYRRAFVNAFSKYPAQGLKDSQASAQETPREADKAFADLLVSAQEMAHEADAARADPSAPAQKKGPKTNAVRANLLSKVFSKKWIFSRREDSEDETYEAYSETPERPASRLSRRSVASTTYTRASNVIQLAFIPGITDRSGEDEADVPPVPPVSIRSGSSSPQLPQSPSSDSTKDHYFMPRDLRDSTYSRFTDNTASIFNRQSLAPSIASSLQHRSVTSVIDEPAGGAKKSALAHTAQHGRRLVVNAKSSPGNSRPNSIPTSPKTVTGKDLDAPELIRKWEACRKSLAVLLDMQANSDTKEAGHATELDCKPISNNVNRLIGETVEELANLELLLQNHKEAQEVEAETEKIERFKWYEERKFAGQAFLVMSENSLGWN